MSDSKWNLGKDVFINLTSLGNQDSNKPDMQRDGNNPGDWVNLEFIIVFSLISESYSTFFNVEEQMSWENPSTFVVTRPPPTPEGAYDPCKERREYYCCFTNRQT